MNDKPWEHEPDYAMFMTDAGYVAEIRRRSTMGFLCGYIYIPKGHPCYGLSYNDLYDLTFAAPDVHGGWTFSDTNDECTVFGFDCGHAGDFIPQMRDNVERTYNYPDDVYRDWAFVVRQLELAAKGFKKLEAAHA